jgi:hypothetical protein
VRLGDARGGGLVEAKNYKQAAGARIWLTKRAGARIWVIGT